MAEQMTPEIKRLAANCGFGPATPLALVKRTMAKVMLCSQYCDQHDVRLQEALGLDRLTKDHLDEVANG